MTPQAIFVTIVVILLLIALMKEIMRPGIILLTGAVLFMATGILSGKEMVEGFSNKGMITVAMLYLVSEGVRRSGFLEQVLAKILPKKNLSVRRVQLRMLPAVGFLSAFLNNTPVVVIFAPMIKRWAEKMKQPASKLLIPLSFATILGGMCTLIGTSTNVVVHGMALDEAARNPESGVRGLTMFELGQVGIVIAAAGFLYMWTIGHRLLPSHRESKEEDDSTSQEPLPGHFPIEVVLGPRFPAIGKKIGKFDFEQKYGVQIMQLKRGGQTWMVHDMRQETFREGDTLVLQGDDSFMANWGDSSFFLLVSDMRQQQEPVMGKRKRWLAIILLAIMILGAAIGELPSMREWADSIIPGMKFDMFFFVCITVIIMAWTGMFPARKYTKYISWDILITIASAFAISKAMQNSGMADAVAQWAVSFGENESPYVLLAIVFIIASLFTELMTNNAAAALTFPISLSLAQHLGVNPMPFIITICIAASASFCTPIGYQTNLIVQGVGGYKFGDFVKVGLPLNILALIITVLLVPYFWPF